MELEKNKKNIGISIYPETQSFEEMQVYIEKASELGYKRIFSSLLQVDKNNKHEMIDKMKKIFSLARELGYEVILDVAPNIYEILDIKLPDVSFFEELFVDTIRFDEGVDADICLKIISGSNLNIEVNMSTLKSVADLINISKIDMSRVVASHNFYPQRYTGLDLEYFIEMTKYFKERGFSTSAFITSHSENSEIGPWGTKDGLCTIEDHRDLNSLEQARELLENKYIDGVMFGNAIASDEELSDVSQLEYYKEECELVDSTSVYKEDDKIIEIEIDALENSEVENEILFKYNNHFRRGDITSYFIRSTYSRVEYSNESIPNSNLEQRKQMPYEVYILNDDYGRYKGELHIILKEMPYDKGKNLVGTVKETNLEKLNSVGSWTKFKLK